eukprot:350850-Chlamydomonas_euryale.AAC.7
MPVMTTPRPARSEKSRPSETLPRHTAKNMAPFLSGASSLALPVEWEGQGGAGQGIVEAEKLGLKLGLKMPQLGLRPEKARAKVRKQLRSLSNKEQPS